MCRPRGPDCDSMSASQCSIRCTWRSSVDAASASGALLVAVVVVIGHKVASEGFGKLHDALEVLGL